MSDSMITCPRCGSTMPAGGRFCINCGHIIESPPEQAASQIAPAITEATEQGMPGESTIISTGAIPPDEGTAIISSSIGSTQGENISEGPSAPLEDMEGQSGPPLQTETPSPARPDSWYESLSTSPGEGNAAPADSGRTSADVPPQDFTLQGEPETQPTPDVPAVMPSYPDTVASKGSTGYTPPLQWQPGAYDMSATQPVDIPVSGQASSVQPPSQTQSIFSPPTPPPPTQGQYTQPISPQQGYLPPPPQPPQPPHQTYTPPPAYNSQGLPPGGTQPLPPGQPYPYYRQYPPGYPPPQQAVAPKDPTTALMLELLGYLGFLGIGHIYAGKTNRGIGLLIGWLLYLTASFVLTFCLIGCFMFLAWVVVPPISGVWVKNEMEKESLSGFRQ